ncbi:Pepco domain-containing protein [Nostoc sp.]|uniref:Pepco domain-containing protein n=1 Tax=Nostoc sp. TaxID=1180 RepID=UPI002FFAFF84
MSAENSTPKAIWIITEETAEKSSTTNETFRNIGARSSGDTGRRLGIETTEEIIVSRKKDEIVITRHKVEVTKLKQEMKGFLEAMREMLDEADQPDSKMQLNEVELSVEVNGEGQISLFGIGGGKAGGKGAMTFKFKRK